MTQNTSPSEDYSEVEYLQFKPGGIFRLVQSIFGVLSWPVVLPLALVSRLSDIVFRSVSELFALVPYFPGVILRYEFYRFALRRCGKNVLFELGTVFIYRDIEIGNNVLIGRYCIIHHCDFGNDVLVGERCTFLSGSRQHHFERSDIPMSAQGGAKKRIRIGDDCWIGSHSVLMECVDYGSVVAAGTIVNKPVKPMSIVAGNPAKLLRTRS